MTPLLALIIGVAIGWYAKWVRETLLDIKDSYEERKVDKNAGIVRPSVRKGIPVRAQVQVLDDEDTGGVRPPTPREMAAQDRLAAQRALDKSIQEGTKTKWRLK